jgi:hypothetical protein
VEKRINLVKIAQVDEFKNYARAGVDIKKVFSSKAGTFK